MRRGRAALLLATAVVAAWVAGRAGPVLAAGPAAGAACAAARAVAAETAPRRVVYGFFTDVTPISYAAAQDPADPAFHEPLGYEPSLIAAVETFTGGRLRVEPAGIGAPFDGVWLKAADPAYDLVGGGIGPRAARTRDAAGRPVIRFGVDHLAVRPSRPGRADSDPARPAAAVDDPRREAAAFVYPRTQAGDALRVVVDAVVRCLTDDGAIDLAAWQASGGTLFAERALTRRAAPVAEEVHVVASTGAGAPIEAEEVAADLLQVFQLPTDRFQEALPLLPGVVRGPRGRLSFNGTRPSQSTLLVNGANATDPVTGQFALNLPVSVIETVEVHAIPYSAEFGRVSGAVAEVTTRAGGDAWEFDVDSLVPSPRFRNGTFSGINTATPRMQVRGPLRRGRVWLSQAAAYRFARSRVREALPGEDEEIVDGFDTFTQVDVAVSDRHRLTGTLSIFPSTVHNRGIDALTPAAATPDTESTGWNVALADQLVTGPNTLWRTRFALRGFALEVRPQHAGVARLTPDGLRGAYFNAIDRVSRQLEIGVARVRSIDRGRGRSHLVTVGAQVTATSFHGTDRSGPIEVRGADGRLLRRITFRGAGALDASDVITSGYVQDHWQIGPRFALDLGLRFDHDAMIGERHLSPRAAFSLALDDDSRTILKGGWGLFFDHVLLPFAAFPQFQQRVEQRFHGAPARPAGPPVVFENRAAPDAEQPLSRVWNIELDRQMSPSILLRVNYRENRAFDRPIVQRVVDAAGPALVLSPTGRLLGQAFDATVRWTIADRGDLFVSYSKIRTAGDLNDFGDLYDTVRDPLLLPNEDGAQAFEVPNRVLVWGVLDLGRGITITPGIEWRDGFPYTAFAEDYTPVGPRNGAQFPAFFSADLAVTKRLTLLGRRSYVGVQLYNLANHHNPRDAASNLARTTGRLFRNSVGTSVKLRLGFGL